MISKVLHKFYRKLLRLRLEPIRIFCLHHVCEQFDVETMYPCDWMALSEFKQKIKDLHNQGYQFISLTDAYNHLKNDLFRRKKYAVLTFDDGYKSLLEVLPWLEQQNIPATLFINGKYLDGTSYRESPKEQYLTYDELFALNSPLIEIGHHGWSHTPVCQMTNEEFIQSLRLNLDAISNHPWYIPFWAYTYGNSTIQSDSMLQNNQLVPVKVSGAKNNSFLGKIERESLFYVDAKIKAAALCRNKGICKKCIYKF